MPILHKNLDELREELVSCDLLCIDRRIGNKTVVFEVDDLPYDPTIPLIDDNKLERWLESHRETVADLSSVVSSKAPSLPADPEPEPQPVVEPEPDSEPEPEPKPAPEPKPKLKPKPRPASPLKRQPSPTKLPKNDDVPEKPTALPSTSKIKTKKTPKNSSKKPRVKPAKPKKYKPTLSSASETQSDNEVERPAEEKLTSNKKVSPLSVGSPKDNVDDESSSVSSTSEGSAPKAVWKCETDELVINEIIDDEYAQYDDDDNEETELSKNLKKIRTAPPPTQPAKQSLPAKLTTSVERRCTTRARSLSRSPSPPPVPKEPVKPPEPNWPETAKLVQTNQFSNAYKDLCFFKAHIKSDSMAKTLPKEIVLKCLQEDETNLLVDMLNLLYELDYNDDIDFWSELVQRLKRKLSTHSSVRKYKVKTNPDWVYANYKRAIKSLSDYSRSMNLTLKLPFHAMLFLIDPASCCDQKPAQEGTTQTIVTNDSNSLGPVLKSTAPNPPAISTATSATPNCNISTTVVSSTPASSTPVFTTITNTLNCTTTTNTNATATTAAKSNGTPANDTTGVPRPTPLPTDKKEPLSNGSSINNLKCKAELPQLSTDFPFVTFPDIKPKVKIERNENMATNRRVTFAENVSGQPCFKIMRRKRASGF